MNHLYYGDNLAVLRESSADASVDLVYLDRSAVKDRRLRLKNMMDTENVSSPADTSLQTWMLIRDMISEKQKGWNPDRIEYKSRQTLNYLRVLARCARSACIVNYFKVKELAGEPQGQDTDWLNDVYDFAVEPLGLPDVTNLAAVSANRVGAGV
mgnify:CR=1 FL=1